MNNKNLQRIFSALIAISMVFAMPIANAAEPHEITRDYTPGETVRFVGGEDLTAGDGILSAGESAVYEFYSPYAMRGVTFEYTGSGTVTLDMGDNVYADIFLPQGGNYNSGAYRLEFGDFLGYEPQQYWGEDDYARDYVEREYVECEGEKIAQITASAENTGDITITRLGFEKEKTVLVVGDYDDYYEQIQVSCGGATIAAGGSQTFEADIDIESAGMRIFYKGGGKATIGINNSSYTVNLPVVSESATSYTDYLLEYDVNKGQKNQRPWAPDIYEGTATAITVTADNSNTGNIILEQILVIKKEGEKAKNGALPGIDPNSTKSLHEEEIYDEINTLSSVMLDEGANVIRVNGATRYIDYNDTKTKPYNYKGHLYLPINTLAKALGYYYEDDTDTNYALMRSETHEYVIIGDDAELSQGTAEKQTAPNDAIIYREGETLAQVRYFAELKGKTVGYRDGLVVIDNKHTVKDVIEDDAFYNKAKGWFKDHRGTNIIGNTYYVSQNGGSDSNDGRSKEKAFKTIQKAANVASAGDIVIISAGVYREEVIPKNSGTANSPITYRVAEGDEGQVTISAADVLGKPSKTAGGYETTNTVYELDMTNINLGADSMATGALSTTRNQIFINGEMQTEARFPNGPEYLYGGSFSDGSKLSNAWPTRGNFYVEPKKEDTTGTDIVRSDNLLWDVENDYWNGGIFVGSWGYSYQMLSAPIIDTKEGQLTLGVNKPMQTADTSISRESSFSHPYNWGYIVGHPKALDAPGEWIRTDEGKLHIILPENANANSDIEAKARVRVFDLRNKSYINIEGINTIGGSITMDGSNMCVLNNMNMKYITHIIHSADRAAGFIDFPTNRTRNGKRAPVQGEAGIYFGGTNCALVNSVIDHSATSGVYLTGTYSYIDNNVINDCGYAGGYVSGIYLNMVQGVNRNAKHEELRGGHGIYNNTVYNTGRTAITYTASGDSSLCYWAPFIPSDIAYNDFHDGMLTSADGGIVYMYHVIFGNDVKNTELHHNYIYRTTKEEDLSVFGSGIYYDSNTAGIDTYDNLVFFKGKNSPFTWRQIFACDEYRVAPIASNIELWDNYSIGYVEDDVDNIDAAYFTEDKPFYAGVKEDGKKYTVNYDRFKQNKDGMQYPASQAQLGGATLDSESGYANMSQGGTITFKNVNFGEKSNEIAIAVRGNRNFTHDMIEVTIGDAKYTDEVVISARQKDDSQTQRITLNDISGTKDVTIKVTDYKSLQIGGISVYKYDNDMINDDFVHFAWGGTYTGILKEGVDGTYTSYTPPVAHGPASSTYKSEGHNNHPIANMISYAPSGYKLVYENQEFSAPAKYLAISLSSGSDITCYQDVEVYVDGAKVAATKTECGPWAERERPLIIELENAISAGTHKIELRFPRTDNAQKVCKIYSIGFLKDGADLTKFGAPTIIYCGEYTAEDTVRTSENYYTHFSTSGKAEQPLLKAYMDGLYTRHGVMNVFSGSELVYNKVQMNGACDEINISYSADAGYQGQTIEVYAKEMSFTEDVTDIGNKIATFTTVDTGYGFKKDNTQSITPLTDGALYKVTVRVTGGGDNAVCKLHKIEFK